MANGVLAVNSGDVLLLDNERKLFPYVPGITFGHRRGGLPGPSRPGLRRHAGRARIGTLRLDAATGSWVVDGTAADLGSRGTGLGCGSRPGGDLWLGTAEHGLFRVQFEPAGAATVTGFFDRPGPLHGVGYVYPFRGEGPLVLWTRTRGRGASTRRRRTIAPLTAFGPRFDNVPTNLGDNVSPTTRAASG